METPSAARRLTPPPAPQVEVGDHVEVARRRRAHRPLLAGRPAGSHAPGAAYSWATGSGVGSGLILGGRLHSGAQGVAGEFGHVKVIPPRRTTAPRLCDWCRKPLTPREGEKLQNFINRNYCSRTHAAYHRNDKRRRRIP